MTEQEILDGNRLIVEFMGYEYIAWNDPNHKCLSYTSGYWGKKGAKAHHLKFPKTMILNPLKFHCSWDSLQPAAKKAAEYIRVDDTGFNWQKNIYHAIKTFDINEVWEKTVDFIKWYNLNK